jgi:aconitase A
MHAVQTEASSRNQTTQWQQRMQYSPPNYLYVDTTNVPMAVQLEMHSNACLVSGGESSQGRPACESCVINHHHD